MSYTVSQLVNNKIDILQLNILQRTKEQEVERPTKKFIHCWLTERYLFGGYLAN